MGFRLRARLKRTPDSLDSLIGCPPDSLIGCSPDLAQTDVKAASDKASSSSSSSSSFEASRANEGLTAALSDQSRVIVARPVRGVVSLWTCSKFCALAFVAGIIVGYTLKQRVKRWANKLLKKIRDD